MGGQHLPSFVPPIQCERKSARQTDRQTEAGLDRQWASLLALFITGDGLSSLQRGKKQHRASSIHPFVRSLLYTWAMAAALIVSQSVAPLW